MKLLFLAGAASAVAAAEYSAPGYSVYDLEEGWHEWTNGENPNVPCSYNGKDDEWLYSNPESQLVLNFKQYSGGRLRVQLIDSAKARYQVPIPIHEADPEDTRETAFQVFYNNQCQFRVTRKSNQKVIFDTSSTPLVFEDQYLEISSTIFSDDTVYGIGEKFHETSMVLDRNNRTYGIFARDRAVGPEPEINTYGSHPFYEVIEENGNSHGVLFWNSNAQEFEYQLEDDADSGLMTWRSIGGIIDLHFYVGENPEDMLSLYTEAIGRPVLQPYWALGFQICRWGYQGDEDLSNQFYENVNANVPFDIQYVDIDYMDRKMDFTLGQTWQGLPKFVEEDVYAKNQKKMIIILDPAINANETSYSTYDTGVRQGVFLDTYGTVWPVTDDWEEKARAEGIDPDTCDWRCQKAFAAWVQFPNFWKNDTSTWWHKEITDYYNVVKFSGIWIDMNEPASFVEGHPTDGCVQTDSDGLLNYPPFLPYGTESDADDERNGENGQRHIFSDTICMDVQGEVTADFVPEHITRRENESHYNLHSLYGHSEIQPTMDACVDSTGERCTVIGRSTFPGSASAGAGHWLGDNDAKWCHLRQAVIGPQEFSIFGFSYTGTDICGFFNDAEREMCIRWHQIGAMHTFSRNHNVADTKRQDPASWDSKAIELINEALLFRYTWLPTLYSLMADANRIGASVIRAPSHVFYTDHNCRDLPYQFLWADILMFTPVVYQGATTVDVYFPEFTPSGNTMRYYSVHDGSEIGAEHLGNTVTLPAELDQFHVFQLGGSMVVGHDIDYEFARSNSISTEYLKGRHHILNVALDINHQAKGLFYHDSWTSVDPMGTNQYKAYHFVFADDTLSMAVAPGEYTDNVPTFSKITVLGYSGEIGSVVDQNTDEELAFTFENGILEITGELAVDTLNLRVAGLEPEPEPETTTETSTTTGNEPEPETTTETSTTTGNDSSIVTFSVLSFLALFLN